MATWKKVIVSGSSADLLNVSASAGFKGNLVGNVTGTATQVGNSLTVDDSTIQLNSGTTYDGAAARTISVKDSGVTLAKQADMAADRIQGRANGAGTGAPQALTAAQVRTIINVEDGADVTDAAGIAALGVGIVSSSAQVSSLAGTNDSAITITAGDGLGGGGVFTTNTGSDGIITLSVNVDDSTIETNSDTLRIKDDGVTYAKIQNVSATNRILGRDSAGAGIIEEITPTALRTMINVEDGADVTDATNVEAAGALMDSELSEIATVKALTAAGISGSLSATAIAALGASIVSSSAQVDISGKTVAASQVTEISNLTAAEGAQLENIDSVTISNTQWGYLGGQDQSVATTASPTFNDLRVSGDLTVEGSRTELQVANLNVEDQYILLNSGSDSGDSGIIFGGSNATANSGHALILDNSYNSNDGRLAVQVTDKAAGNADDFTAGTTGYYLAGVYEGSEANAATAKADHPGNIRIENSEIFIYV